MANIPNWCIADVKVKGKPKDIENFCKLFLFDEDTGGDIVDLEKDKYFARSFTNTKWKDFKKDFLGKNKVSFSVDFAWSCMFEGYPEQYEKDGSITLEWAMKKHNVEVEIETEEGGMGFEEKIITKEGKPIYENLDMPEHTCMACGSKQSIPSSYDLDEEECSNCEKIGKWKDELTELMKEKLKQIKEVKK